MIDALHLHRSTDLDTGMRVRFPYVHFMITLNELDEFAMHVERIQPEILNKGQIITALRERLDLLGFRGKISDELPNFLFTYGKIFPKAALGGSETHATTSQETTAGIVFARGSDENWEYSSSLLAALALTSGQRTSSAISHGDRFTLAFMTGQVPLNLDRSLEYPFSQRLPRQVIQGSILYPKHTVKTTITKATPSARDHIMAVLQTNSRKQRRGISLEDATEALLSHFFINTPHQSGYMSHFYQPTDFVKNIST